MQVETVSQDYFFTQVLHSIECVLFTNIMKKRFEQYQEAKQSKVVQLDHADTSKGTVGCVALDVHGQLCAGNSTGGMTNKLTGRGT
jgi:isoaspartyl peptidase/L-asparaginase-like protein (Ntn-hydrolase superfamily)